MIGFGLDLKKQVKIHLMLKIEKSTMRILLYKSLNDYYSFGGGV